MNGLRTYDLIDIDGFASRLYHSLSNHGDNFGLFWRARANYLFFSCFFQIGDALHRFLMIFIIILVFA